MSDQSTCQCFRCLTKRDERIGDWPVTMTRMILCQTCGCKRCPHATDHRFACTDSNESGQPGSRYGRSDCATPETSIQTPSIDASSGCVDSIDAEG